MELTLWLLKGDLLDPSWYVFVVFSFLLNFCKQWHLCKFLILGDLTTHLFGLVFPRPTSEKMRVGSNRPPPPPSSIKVGFFKTSFFKKQLKNVAQGLFVHACV